MTRHCQHDAVGTETRLSHLKWAGHAKSADHEGRPLTLSLLTRCPQTAPSGRPLPTETRLPRPRPTPDGKLGGMRCRLWPRLLALLLLVPGLWWVLPSAPSGATGWAAPLPEPLTVTRPFDPPQNPYGAGHRGVDLAGSPGQEVRAAGAGTVVYAGPLAGRGVVSVQHADGLRTTYEPVLASVATGVSVRLGQVIGSLDAGHAGCPVSACLHWGLKRGELYLDPMLLLSQGPVRLLPRYGAGQSGADFDPVLAMTGGPLAIGGLGLSLMSRTRRLHCTRPARTAGYALGAMHTKRQQCGGHSGCGSGRRVGRQARGWAWR